MNPNPLQDVQDIITLNQLQSNAKKIVYIDIGNIIEKSICTPMYEDLHSTLSTPVYTHIQSRIAHPVSDNVYAPVVNPLRTMLQPSND